MIEAIEKDAAAGSRLLKTAVERFNMEAVGGVWNKGIH
jgi:hypothetical protein